MVVKLFDIETIKSIIFNKFIYNKREICIVYHITNLFDKYFDNLDNFLELIFLIKFQIHTKQ